ncbi:cytochrome b5 [Rozella allomycis CSF55]|uniref:Cytochrome b5 n=1 Tax=Rozella allomycis (strain CSF55) TaxID=988480 RepID=A0A075AXB1_ROZAC|nr:Cytochrome b5-like heme/steroid binding domain-containing protein [Rozella allomycis CSF55]RKP17293.1 cytochrome b5 [Rozella allomycis CSF55]|eukprot:EPZ33159.1 Cytochrome b5-like heme/steroid binding domain-containing protein [Rozella allomycis CSF55]
MKKITKETLAKYNGLNEETENKIYLAVNGLVFDVTSGSQFYGPGAPYGVFAGKDATYGLANNKVEINKDEAEELSESQKKTAKEWQTLFEGKYELVGELIN